VTNRTLEIR
jgi:hypothetical protein